MLKALTNYLKKEEDWDNLAKLQQKPSETSNLGTESSSSLFREGDFDEPTRDFLKKDGYGKEKSGRNRKPSKAALPKNIPPSVPPPEDAVGLNVVPKLRSQMTNSKTSS